MKPHGRFRRRARRLPRRGPRLAEGELSAGAAGRQANWTDPEAIWGGRAFAGSDDPQIVWMQRGRRERLDRADLARGIRRRRAVARQGARASSRSWRRYRTPLASFGIWMLGPVLLEFANEAQKAEHLPKIVRARSAGARATPSRAPAPTSPRLQTRCEDKGDHWLINGQKIWTCYANNADWCFCLVRTDPTAKKHEGICFVLIDMATPGVETRPIKLISRREPVLRDLLHRREDPQGATWSASSTAAGRSPSGCCSTSGRTSPAASAAAAAPAARRATSAEIAKRYVGVDETGALADADLRGRITRNKMDFQAFCLTLVARRGRSRAPATARSAATSIIKYAAATFAQERSELMVEAMGAPGPRLGRRRLHARPSCTPPTAGCAPRATRSRAAPRRSTSTWSPSACWACPTRSSDRSKRDLRAISARLLRILSNSNACSGSDLRWRILAATPRPSGWRRASWLEENFPASLKKNPMAPDGRHDGRRGGERRRQAVARAHGRQGLGRADLAEGIRRRRALAAPRRACWPRRWPRSAPATRSAAWASSMFGPTLLEYGTEEQKQQHIPPIVSGELRWCQGYSEPGAGSDLASPADPLRGQGRPLAGQRPEDLDLGRPVRRLVLLPGAHRPEGQEARGHLAS